MFRIYLYAFRIHTSRSLSLWLLFDYEINSGSSLNSVLRCLVLNKERCMCVCTVQRSIDTSPWVAENNLCTNTHTDTQNSSISKHKLMEQQCTFPLCLLSVICHCSTFICTSDDWRVLHDFPIERHSKLESEHDIFKWKMETTQRERWGQKGKRTEKKSDIKLFTRSTGVNCKSPRWKWKEQQSAIVPKRSALFQKLCMQITPALVHNCLMRYAVVAYTLLFHAVSLIHLQHFHSLIIQFNSMRDAIQLKWMESTLT